MPSTKRISPMIMAARFSCIAIIYPRMFLFAVSFIEVHWNCNWFVGSLTGVLIKRVLCRLRRNGGRFGAS